MWKFRKKKPTTPNEFYDKLYGGTDVAELQRQTNTHAIIQSFKDKDLDLKDKEDFLKLRIFWGRAIFGLLAITFSLNILLVVLVGTGAWTFQNQTFLNIVAGQNFVQVLGLVAIILRALFPNKSKK